jgi:uncharacterized coiled-coil DUF342 family protein
MNDELIRNRLQRIDSKLDQFSDDTRDMKQDYHEIRKLLDLIEREFADMSQRIDELIEIYERRVTNVER